MVSQKIQELKSLQKLILKDCYKLEYLPAGAIQEHTLKLILCIHPASCVQN